MDDLSSLCTICHIEPPIYTCPRCNLQTCSLACSKRHKIRSMCNGIRDPTKFLPIEQVATPWGIDHDYNFLHGIETSVARSEKVLIQDLELISIDEMERARTGESIQEYRRRTGRGEKELPGEACIERDLKWANIRVMKAPKGMKRNKENATGWNKRQRCIIWQVEWIREGKERTLFRAMGNRPIGEFYEAMVEEERILNMSEKERREKKKGEKRRRADEVKRNLAKRARGEEEKLDMTSVPILQDPKTGTWNVAPVYSAREEVANSEREDSIAMPPPPKPRDYKFYLHRPLTPASFPKVLAPISHSKPLTEQLRKREVLEFPTIHVFPSSAETLPEGFMLEEDFLKAVADGKKGVGKKMEQDVETEDEDSTDSEDTSSGEESDSEESMEDGEIA
ncbi:related to BCD1 Protein required for box C/D snoRNA accumulation [Rhynchosporium secalis]|uniref:Box C/D snoRNA protein 1 n=1 Tax=Rhynchosporium secalis TaxID=38038 RepID=A0A1E1MUN1_RHYSE|nr:related to BCD1 Protein required for box C/D snoRNA accumulation [Rhynchosporium secalis]